MDGLVIVHPEHVLVKSCKEAFPDLDERIKKTAVQFLDEGLPVWALCRGDLPDYLSGARYIPHPGNVSSIGLKIFDQVFTFAARMMAQDFRDRKIEDAIVVGLYYGACCKTMNRRLNTQGIKARRDGNLTDLHYL